MKLILTVFITLTAVFLPDVDGSGSLLFPEPTAHSHVMLSPDFKQSLGAFTLCLRFSSELSRSPAANREVILFAYRTQDYDELNVWRELDGRFSFYLSGPGVSFPFIDLGILENHLCFVWESLTGQARMYINGRSSAARIFQKGHKVQSGGKVLLGQDADIFLGDFDINQSFVGEIFEVNMWDSVLPASVIRDLAMNGTAPRPNALDWETAVLEPTGSAVLI